MSKTQKRTVLICLAFVLLVGAVAAVYVFTRPALSAGQKTVTIIVESDTQTREHTIQTDAEYLAGALKDCDFVKGEDSAYGFFLTEADGRVANAAEGEYWMIYQHGTYTPNGVNLTPVADGDRFTLKLEVYA